MLAGEGFGTDGFGRSPGVWVGAGTGSACAAAAGGIEGLLGVRSVAFKPTKKWQKQPRVHTQTNKALDASDRDTLASRLTKLGQRIASMAGVAGSFGGSGGGARESEGGESGGFSRSRRSSTGSLGFP